VYLNQQLQFSYTYLHNQATEHLRNDVIQIKQITALYICIIIYSNCTCISIYIFWT